LLALKSINFWLLLFIGD